MKKILSYALIIAMLASTSCSKDEDNSVVPIPDPAFKAFLIEYYDLNHNGEISFSEAKVVTSMPCHEYPEIKSIEGIEYFTELEQLSIARCNITSIDISDNINLLEFNCSETKLSSLDVSKNINLTYLICNENQLTYLDVSKNVKLVSLFCSDNQLTELDVSKNILLEIVHCDLNKFELLDFRFNIHLREIECIMASLKTLILIKGHIYGISSYPDINIIYI
jgi:Leucine-rich repeat (LRR) protein